MTIGVGKSVPEMSYLVHAASLNSHKMAAIRGSMNAEFDHDLTARQWEALKALRLPAARRQALNRFIVDRLIALGLAAWADDQAMLTEDGRKALIRGSFRLWDVAA